MTRARKRKDALGWALIGVTFTLLIAAAIGVALLRPPPTDAETLCRTDAPIAAHTLIVVDSTDKLEPRHKKRLRAAVESERAKLARYEKLTIVALRADRPREPRILFSLCDPGDASLVNPLFANTRNAQKRWAEAFGAPLDSAMRRASATRRGDASPIVETLAAVAADPDFSPAIARRRLVVISDLMEHNPHGFSLYREEADFAAFTAAGDIGVPDLAGVAVRIVPLDRPDLGARQTQARTRFWAPFLAATGADEIVWDASL